MYTNIQCIKNSMKCYDKDGDYINPRNGLAGLVLTDENASRQKRIISIPESSKDEMFEQTKKEFLQENGVANGDTTRRTDVYDNLYRKMKKDDRLAAGYTMQQYERAYRNAFYAAARKADSKWEIGKPIPSGALDGITRESVESNLKKPGRSRYTDIILTPYPAEAHKTLPLRTARVQGRLCAGEQQRRCLAGKVRRHEAMNCSDLLQGSRSGSDRQRSHR